jgi:hypothetical protein
MSHYIAHRPTALGARGALGAISLGGSVDEIAGQVAGRVTEAVANRVSSELSRGIDRGVERMSEAASTGFDRFLDSPTGKKAFDKLENKLSNVAVNTANRHQTNLALLGIAGAAIVMGSVYVGSKMTSRGAALAFLVGGVTAGLVASGVFSPPDEDATKPPVPPVTLPSPVRRPR